MVDTPIPVVMPRVSLDGKVPPRLGVALESLVVHCKEGRGAASLTVDRESMPELRTLVSLGHTMLEVTLAGASIFTGKAHGVDLLVREAAAPRVVLRAKGDDQPGGTIDPTPLRLDHEILSLVVRQRRGISRIRCVTTVLTLRHGCRVALTTADAAFDGSFQVTEIWHRFDGHHGARVEFIGEGVAPTPHAGERPTSGS
ncbi:hypothetical protein EKO23_01900 [Nocardioides guangzhouensis]|uniref:Uncharacterized protein n=1 Tax=Nocardioides guangzhouensis TaxID=2497878 RepID=A0A4Q4ZKT9_9ACTN|nr:hypothetical protein [Nocardioides guangzhouensis]RYP88668.1 hypothetical protein EKO23_01900 [Nocardioides guangzhouensis]